MTEQRSSLSDAEPLFLIGPPRSGTTLMARILNAHPRVLMTNETAVFIQLSQLIEKSRKGIDAGIMYGKEYNVLWSDNLRQHSAELVLSYYEKIADVEGKKDLAYWGEKHPHLSDCTSFLSSLYPEARYVYALRDPRDAACSMSEMNKVPIRSALDNWKAFSDVFERFVDTLDPDRVINVSYESLIHDYEGVSEKLFRGLGLEMTEEVLGFLERFSSVDSHLIKSRESDAQTDFVSKSFRRWEKEMSQTDKSYALVCVGDFLGRYGYDEEPLEGKPQAKEEVDQPSSLPDSLDLEMTPFTCNICGADNEANLETLDRETASCSECGSSVRTRSLIALLSQELFGESLTIADFPVLPRMRGIDLSGWFEYARRLPHKLTYTNTFYHKEPYFDVTQPRKSDFKDLDFMICSEVFEHIPQPVSRAFAGAYEVLKPGASLVLTVPYEADAVKTIEHFPPLDDYWVEEGDGSEPPYLYNRKPDGAIERFSDLRFHGGPGQTLEMRVFSQADLMSELEAAGFSSVEVCDKTIKEHGIVWNAKPSRPIVARK